MYTLGRMTDCCLEFARYHEDPASYFETEKGIDFDLLSQSPDGERRVTVTARGLMLTRELSVQHDRDTHYDFELGRHALPRWSHDTYFGGLGLSAEAIHEYRRGRVLDVGAGLAVFGTELSVLGATVDCLDLELDDAHPSFALTRQYLAARYARQLEFLRCLARHGGGERYALDDSALQLLDTLIGYSAEIVARYPAVSGRRLRGDARGLGGEADEYDAVLSGWLMVHLEPDDERRVVTSMARVTRPGGRMHIRAGYGGDLAARLRSWFPDATIAGKRFELESATEDLAVLRATV